MAKKTDKVEAAPVVEAQGTHAGIGASVEFIVLKGAQNTDRGVPTLVGPTGWGKTRSLGMLLQAAGFDPVVIVNPQVDLPEDIGGHPRVGPDGFLTFTQPSMIPKELVERDGWALIVDELDKSREDNQSAMLSLFEERRIRNTFLRPGVALVAAMNEPKRPLRPELLSRLLLVPYPGPDTRVLERIDLSRNKWLWDGLYDAPPAVRLPERERSPRAAHRLTPWIEDAEFWGAERETVRTLVVQGLCDTAMRDVVLSRFAQHRVTVEPIEWAKACTPRQFVETVVDVLTGPKPEAIRDALQQIVEHVKADASGEWSRAYEVVFGDPDVFEAIGAPDKRDAAMKKVRTWLKKSAK